MIYILCALQAEAQAFVDKYKLNKESLSTYKLFTNEKFMVIVSGIGVENAMRATQTLINHYDITDDDLYLNIGICAADKGFEIGELIQIDAIEYEGLRYKISKNTSHILTCIDKEANTQIAEIVDMESFGFYEAVKHSPAIKNFYILKVVSDHFEPKKVTKELAKSLIFNKIDAINTIINPDKETI